MGKPFRTDHKVICEFSQNVLFTYLMIVLWYLFVIGICLSGVGLFYHLVMAYKHEMHDHEENRRHSMSGGKHDICFTRDEHNLLHILMKRDYEKAFKIAHKVKKRRIAGKKSFLEYDYYQEKEEREEKEEKKREPICYCVDGSVYVTIPKAVDSNAAVPTGNTPNAVYLDNEVLDDAGALLLHPMQSSKC